MHVPSTSYYLTSAEAYAPFLSLVPFAAWSVCIIMFAPCGHLHPESCFDSSQVLRGVLRLERTDSAGGEALRSCARANAVRELTGL